MDASRNAANCDISGFMPTSKKYEHVLLIRSDGTGDLLDRSG